MQSVQVRQRIFGGVLLQQQTHLSICNHHPSLATRQQSFMFLEIASLFYRGNSFDNLEQAFRVSIVQIDAVSKEPHGFLLEVILKVFSKKNILFQSNTTECTLHIYLPVCLSLSVSVSLTL